MKKRLLAVAVVAVFPVILIMVANYGTQCQVVFDTTGVGSDFTGTIVTVDGLDYNATSLPVSFSWNHGTTHSFSFSSPLVMNASVQYVWHSTCGLSSLKEGNLTVASSGSVVGNYLITNCVTFDQTGVGSDFTEGIVEIDSMLYGVSSLPVCFNWQTGSVHNFTFHSPLTVDLSLKQYVWTSSGGLSTLRNGSLTVTAHGSVIGDYATQYYLTLTTTPLGVASPSGAGWYDANTNATVSTTMFVDVLPGCSRYRFNGWTTANIAEIADPTKSLTTVLMDRAKAVTANYIAQYVLVFKQYGVGTDFAGTVVTIDTIDYNVASLPATFWWDNGTAHSFDFKSALTVSLNGKRYVWNCTTGLSTQQGSTIVVASYGNVTGSYMTQYYLTVSTSPPGVATIPGEGWYNESASAVLTAPTVTDYEFAHWIVNGVSQEPSVNPITLTMNAAQNATAEYTRITLYTLTVATTLGGSTDPSPNIYTYPSGTVVQVTGLPSSGYMLDHWEFDGNNVSSTMNPYTVTMDANHSLKAFFSLAPPPPYVTISPANSTIVPGGSVSFTSVVVGGTTPYAYQWFLDGAPVQGATSSGWTFTQTSTGLYFVYLKVTDANSNTAYSNDARVTVVSVPVGGYSVSLFKRESLSQMAAYATLIGLLAVAAIVVKRKRK